MFKFKCFSIHQENSALKVGTDSMLLGSLINADSPSHILDIGTGCGVLSLMMAQRFSSAKVYGLEIDADSCKDAQLNFENSAWSDRLELIHHDFFNFSSAVKFDLIISNPPYHFEEVRSENSRMNTAKRWSKFEFQQFYSTCAELSHPQSDLYLIVPYLWHEEHLSIANSVAWQAHQKIIIHGNSDKQNSRVVINFKRHGTDDCMVSEITIRNIDGAYSEEYKTLTKNFHGVNI
ncbi:MAG: methyltransferase [Bacteroidetes bacterium]|nr:methyltransferase [Bacteroidota bacterium]